MMNARREFLKLSAASLMALAGGMYAPGALALPYDPEFYTGGNAGKKGREYIALCGGVSRVKERPAPGYDPGVGSIFVSDVASGDGFEVPVPFAGHTVDQNPSRPHHLVSFEKWGRKGGLIDLKERKVLALADAADQTTFFGHCAFSADGRHLITTEGEPDVQIGRERVFNAQQGKLIVRDASSLKIIEKMNSHGRSPHQCCAVDGGKTLVVVNGGYDGAAPNLSWIDFQSGKLLNQIELGAADHVAHFHFDLSADGWACVAGVSHNPKDNLVVLISPDGRVLEPAIPEAVAQKIKITTQTVAFLGRNDLVAVTFTLSNMMLVFNYKKQILVEAIDLKNPKGILPVAAKNESDSDWLVSLAGGEIASIAERKGMPAATRVLAARQTVYNGHLSRFYV